jgi:hypothetical protein
MQAASRSLPGSGQREKVKQKAVKRAEMTYTKAMQLFNIAFEEWKKETGRKSLVSWSSAWQREQTVDINDAAAIQALVAGRVKLDTMSVEETRKIVRLKQKEMRARRAIEEVLYPSAKRLRRAYRKLEQARGKILGAIRGKCS